MRQWLSVTTALLFFSVGHGAVAHDGADGNGDINMATERKPDVWRSLATVSRGIPVPPSEHPGNVFLVGEEVTVPVPSALRDNAVRWRAVDDRGKVLAEGDVKTGGQAGGQTSSVGTLGLGWYRIEFLDSQGRPIGWTTAAVLSALNEVVPQDSPVCVDSATSWFSRRYRGEEAKQQEIVARLAALAGVNWIRDRMAWGHLETAPGQFARDTIYDSSATLQERHGLKVLQVFHHTPGWATDAELDGKHAGKRFPRDLRALYRFCKAMAERYKRRVSAWEPWNEANIRHFGGHTIDEMCTLQKAAYLGFKAGDRDVVVCWNVYAGSGSRLHSEGVLDNEAWPYFETYNIHSYSDPSKYLSQFATARAAACGRPIWITECGIRLPSKMERPWGELSPKDEIRQAEFIARSYASSLFAGVNRHFFFILGNYVEGKTQFGLLRHDQTPRPGYVALATVGRFLAGAKSIGRLMPKDAPGVHVYAFRARANGTESGVLVIWADEAREWTLPAWAQAKQTYDYLGRPIEKRATLMLRSAAVFVVMPPGEVEKLSLEPPPKPTAHRKGKPSSVVLQAQFPHVSTKLETQAHEIEPGTEADLPLFAYNFNNRPVAGTVTVAEAPPSWRISPSNWRVRLNPMERRRLTAQVCLPSRGRELLQGGRIKLKGDFANAGRPVLSFRLAAALSKLDPVVSQRVASASNPKRWHDNIVRGATMSHGQSPTGGVLFEMRFGKSDPWGYPRLRLEPGEIPDDTMDGLTLVVQVLEGTGNVRVQFIEENGAAYLTEIGIDADARTPQKAFARFSQARWGSYSRPDPDGKLQPRNIRTVLVGINSKRESRVRMVVSGLTWVRF